MISNSDSRMAVRKKKKNNKTIKVLHITDFESIFEPSDAKRKKQRGPLSFTKSLVTTHFLSKEAEIRYFERIKIIKAHTERHLLRSTFEDLKNWTAGKYLGSRGFLVNADYKPASFAYLANQLDHVPIEDLKKALPILEKFGLLERIVFNGFPDVNGQSRTQPDSSGRGRKALNKDKGKTKKNGEGKSKCAKKRQKKSKSKPQKTPLSTTQSFGPQVSARRGQVVGFTVPSELQNTEKLGDIARGMLHRYSADCQEFAFEIFKALKLPFDLQSEEGKRECGCFSSMWQRAAGLKPTVLEELRRRSIEEAVKIAKRHQNRKRGAVWCHVFKGLLSTRCRIGAG